MKKSIIILIAISIPWILFANSITISPDTLSTTIQFGELSVETVTITNNNSSPVNLDISILEQPTAISPQPYHPQYFEPESEELVREVEPDIQYQDENGNWVDGIRCGTAPTPANVLSRVQNAIENNRNKRNSSRNLVNV
ncbi:MAG: hypothetical protein H8E08_00075, partial [Candidatus Marinimicrobia bacterium]|nr:hypothetical protein [Candidatus Neomarinimicrobiota bacterium]